jgi:hypothetical protein
VDCDGRGDSEQCRRSTVGSRVMGIAHLGGS